MSLKYRRSILFDRPQQTTAKLAIQTLVYQCKQKLKLNSRTSSQILRSSPERMTINQAKFIENLQSKLNTISFHTIYKRFQKDGGREEEYNINPEKLQMFRDGKFYRYTQRPKKEEIVMKTQNIKNGIMDYYQRQPEQEQPLQVKKQISKLREKAYQRAKRYHSSKKI